MVVSSRISAQCIEAVSNPSNNPTPPPTTKLDKARRVLTRTCIHNSPERLSSMHELTTARGEGRKRLGRVPAEDAHCQPINSKMGTTQGKACFASILGRWLGFFVNVVCPWFMILISWLVFRSSWLSVCPELRSRFPESSRHAH